MKSILYEKILMLPILSVFVMFAACKRANKLNVEQWKEAEIELLAQKQYKNPYTDVELWVEFSGPQSQKIVRPAFWFEKKYQPDCIISCLKCVNLHINNTKYVKP